MICLLHQDKIQMDLKGTFTLKKKHLNLGLFTIILKVLKLGVLTLYVISDITKLWLHRIAYNVATPFYCKKKMFFQRT
jgi:hypothetical protein